MPNRNAWYADYGPVKQRLEKAGLQVTTAAPNAGPCARLDDAQWPNAPPIVADLALEDATATGYEALIFGGFLVAPFFQEHRETTARLLADFRRQGKLVSAICAGQAVLAQHGVLDGHNAAGGRIIRENFPYDKPGGPQWTNNTVELADSGRLITGLDDKAAPEFADALIRALKR
jgi:protease I